VFREKDGDWTGFGIDWAGGAPRLVRPGQLVVQDGGDLPPSFIQISSPDGAAIGFKRASVAQSGSILDGMEGVTRWVVKHFVGNVILQRGRLDKPSSFYQATVVR